MSDMTVGCIRTTANPNPSSGIYEVLLEKTKKDNAELERQRNHYRQALEEISSSVNDWLNSLIQEPSLDFIHAIKAWADKKLKEV